MEISLKDTLVFFLFTLPVSLSVSTWVVAKFIWEPYVKKSTAEMEDWLDEQEPAKYGYPIDRAKDTPAEGRKGMPLLNCLLTHMTPDGLLYMRYSKDREGLEYWADKSVGYEYLEEAARNYVTQYGCGEMYIDCKALLREKFFKLQEEVKGNRARLANKEGDKEDTESSAAGEDKDEEDVFASFKSYNRKGDRSKSSDGPRLKIKKADLLMDEANTYAHLGRYSEADFRQRKTGEAAGTKSLGFLGWKRLMGANN